MTADRPFSVAVVIPAFNEQHTISQVIARTKPLIDNIVVVEDGSRDDTYQIAQSLSVRVIRHDVNRGKAASLVSGFAAALSTDVDAVITLDGDLQHAPEEIPRFIAEALRFPDSLIIGSRFERKRKVPPLRMAANRFANFWISIACGRRIKDSQCGFRLYPRRLLETVTARHGLGASFVFESEILINATRARFPVRFVAIDAIYIKPAFRKSHYKAVADSVRIFGMVAAKILRL